MSGRHGRGRSGRTGRGTEGSLERLAHQLPHLFLVGGHHGPGSLARHHANRERAEELNGCRGGGIFLFECERVSIRNCVVRNYRGDGISFQVSHHVIVEDCLSENHTGLGIHPGSGSQQPVVRRCRSIGNGQDGLYVCWRVKHGLFEQNEIRGNDRCGISIGQRSYMKISFTGQMSLNT